MATTAGSPIMGPNRLTAQQLADFIRNNGYTPHITVTIDELASYYIDEGAKLGIRGDVAFAQSIIETGGFNFSGSMVEVGDNNFAGIGACDSCHRGFIFPDARTGVRAQLQLLRVYVDPTVTATSLPDPLLLPGTLKLGFRGKVQSWWDLTGTWATAIELRHRDLRPLHAHGDASRRRHRGRGRGRRGRGGRGCAAARRPRAAHRCRCHARGLPHI